MTLGCVQLCAYIESPFTFTKIDDTMDDKYGEVVDIIQEVVWHPVGEERKGEMRGGWAVHAVQSGAGLADCWVFLVVGLSYC